MSELVPDRTDLDEVMELLGLIMVDKSPSEWLTTPNKAFSNQRPIDIINGADEQAKEELMQMLRDFAKIERR